MSIQLVVDYSSSSTTWHQRRVVRTAAMAKKFQLVDTFEQRTPTTPPETKWKLCLVCQEETTESLVCPVLSKHRDPGSGYTTMAANFCIGGAVLVIGTPLEYVQGSRCDLVCSLLEEMSLLFLQLWSLLVPVLGSTHFPATSHPGSSVPSYQYATPPPPNITTSLSSPYVSGHFHWICFARVNNGWSQVRTGIWPGLICWTAFLTTSIECLIIATVWALSWNKGSRDVGVMTGCFGSWCLAWYAAHDVFSQASTSSLRTCLVISSHIYSSSMCWSKLWRLREVTEVAGTLDPLREEATGRTSV